MLRVLSCRRHKTPNFSDFWLSPTGCQGLSAEWRFGDVLSLPIWCGATISGAAGARLLRVADRPVMQALGLYRRAVAS